MPLLLNLVIDLKRASVNDLFSRCTPTQIYAVFYFFQGEQGVFEVLQMLRDELKVAMTLAGLNLTTVNRRLVYQPILI